MFDRVLSALAWMLEAMGRYGRDDMVAMEMYERPEAKRPGPPREDDALEHMES